MSEPAALRLTRQIGPSRVDVVVADITTLAVDAVVNSACSAHPQGGVDGAIHRAAGPGLMAECQNLGRDITTLFITKGHRLPARAIIHVIGPTWSGGRGAEDLRLAECYSGALFLANAHAMASIAFPAVSTGVKAFPRDRAAKIAVERVVGILTAPSAEDFAPDDPARFWATFLRPHVIRHVIFCCRSDASAQHHVNALAAATP